LEQFLTIGLNGITLGALYFIVASGFTLIFGLMRTVNLAHGTLYLLGGYIGLEVVRHTDSWYLAVLGAFIGIAIVGAVIQLGLLSWMQGQDMRQALVTIGLSIIGADLMLARFGGLSYQFRPPEMLVGRVDLPIIGTYASFRLVILLVAIALGVALWLLLSRTKLGMTIRAGIDDRDMLGALGVNVPRVFLIVFALGAGMAGIAGVMGGSALSVTPGLDIRFLLISLVVVIVGGMGSLGGAAIGAMLIGLTEQYSLFYVPTYAALITFALMVIVLAVRPQGILGRPA
jgi:branched-chain amino acid transport system permease protein